MMLIPIARVLVPVRISLALMGLVSMDSASDMKGVAVRPMGGSYLVNQGWTERKTEDGQPGIAAQVGFNRDTPEGSDTEAFLDGYFTITPMQFDWTDRVALNELKDWTLTVEKGRQAHLLRPGSQRQLSAKRPPANLSTGALAGATDRLHEPVAQL